MMFLICHATSYNHLFKWSSDFMFGKQPLTIGQHAANFGGLRHCGRREKTFLIFHVISKNHVFKGLSDVIGGSPLL